jgi:hypothetical protein
MVMDSVLMPVLSIPFKYTLVKQSSYGVLISNLSGGGTW